MRAAIHGFQTVKRLCLPAESRSDSDGLEKPPAARHYCEIARIGPRRGGRVTRFDQGDLDVRLGQCQCQGGAGRPASDNCDLGLCLCHHDDR